MKQFSKNRPYALSPEQYVEYALCNLEKTNKKRRDFYKNYHTYLSTQREALVDEIIQSLKKNADQKIKQICYRVVLSKYIDDPLCLEGSLLNSGRFNFGKISSDYPSFSCLYICSSQEGAKIEKFPNKENMKRSQARFKIRVL